MAKYECRLTGDFNEFLSVLNDEILKGSISASYEDGSDIQMDEIRCAVRVYERYSMIGSNRVSLNLTLVGKGTNLFISAITSGGSQATFFKLNTMGEEAFLDCVYDIVENYKNNRH